MSAPALRPLGVGEILDVGIKIYWRNAWTLFRIVLFVVLPAQILVNIIQVSSLPSGATAHYGFGFPGPSVTANETVSSSDATTVAIAYGIALIINAIAGRFAQAGCFRAVADAYLGEDVSWRASLRYALRRLAAVIALSLLTSIFIGLGFVACVIPGIYLWAAFFVAVPALLVEGVGPMRALRRSRELVRGRWWGTFGVALIGGALVAVVGAALAGVLLGVAFASPRQNTVVGFILTVLATTVSAMLTTPAAAAFATVLYIDLRVRKEGFDLLLLAQRLGVDATQVSRAAAETYIPPEAPTFEGEQPPFWPPPPGWKPSGNPPPPRPPELEEPTEDRPPFWPPPPGWKPGGSEE
jgi:hypothetical protein